ncbi:MAG TPA: helix-hairpin-helix domain-containing protein [Anaeromyxobacteraceae bacterium]
MPRRIAILALLLLTLVPMAFRTVASHPSAPRPCAPEGRGSAPRHWIGCAADPGPTRELTGRERLLVGIPIELNAATPEDLASVPGLSARLAVEVVADRARRGPFATVDALIRVRGIGPARLARARLHLASGP